MTHRFEPIAIVGQSCVLPGALDPEALWQQIHAGRDLLTNASADHWRLQALDRLLAHAPSGGSRHDRVASLRSGVVSGFADAFAQSLAGAERTGSDAGELAGLDAVFQWLLYCGREALRDAGFARGDLIDRPDLSCGAIIGNLSYPTAGFNQLYEELAFEHAGRNGRGHSANGVSANAISPGTESPGPLNRFMSGLPAHWLAQRLGLHAGAFALDAACASALFALKLACDRLQSGQADVMLAGAINAADDLFLHVGFTALQALSPSGRSRPFHREADGLVPSQGAALFVLKTLERARRDGDRILGVIRGVGLSNDGRSRGFLAPAESGQAAAMRAAYAMADLRPADISLIECHATGTAVGDGTEIRSMREIFQANEGCTDIPIGSLKSNLGHLITASGAAGLIKVLKAFEHKTRPATLHVDASDDSSLEELTDSPFRVLSRNEDYALNQQQRNAPRRAAVSSFGFGGNNGHLLVEEWTGDFPAAASFAVNSKNGVAFSKKGVDDASSREKENASPAEQAVAVAIVAMGVRTGELDGVAAFRSALFEQRPPRRKSVERIALDLKALPFPPRDLESTLGQQLLTLAVCDEALAQLKSPLNGERTGVFVGMQCDTEIARYSLRWRLADLLQSHGLDAAQASDAARDDIVAPLESAGVIGRMPNIPANRLNACYDFRGPGFTVSAEELSGIRALEIAAEALRRGEIDAAVVGAVDLCDTPAHTAAARAAQALAADEDPGDAAVVFVCKRLADARDAGDDVYAILEPNALLAASTSRPLPDSTSESESEPLEAERFDTAALFGRAHAVAGLLELSAAVLAARHGVNFGNASSNTSRSQSRNAMTQSDGAGARAASPMMPDLRRTAQARSYSFRGLGGESARVAVIAPPTRVGWTAGEASGIQLFCGEDAADLIQRLESGAAPEDPDAYSAAAVVARPNRDQQDRRQKPARLALIAQAGQDRELQQRAVAALRQASVADTRNAPVMKGAGSQSQDQIAPGIYFRAQPIKGELAFAFTGAASAYAGMGRELLLAYPELHTELAREFAFQDIARYVGWAYEGGQDAAAADVSTAFQQLCGSSYLCQIHARLSQRILGLKPDAVLGLSSGETNSLLAMGVWDEMEPFLRAIEDSGMYQRELAGEFAAVARYRAEHGLSGNDWSDWRLLAPLDQVRECIDREAGVRLTIINTAEDCVIGGSSDACQRVIAELGEELAIPLGHGMAVHCPEVGDFAETWHTLHHRKTHAPPDGVRFYSNHFEHSYVPNAELAAEALTGNALNTIDFPRIIERAYADGVRVFVEHGPRGLLSKWVAQILGDREHCAVRFDAPGESLSVSRDAVARMLVHGIALDYSRFAAPKAAAVTTAGSTFMRSFQAHPAPLRLPAASEAAPTEHSAVTPGKSPVQRMQPAPELAPVETLQAPAAFASNGWQANSSEQPAGAAIPGALQNVVEEHAATYAAFAAELQQLTGHHLSYLEQQRALHAQFLQINQALLSGLSMKAAGDSGASSGAPIQYTTPVSSVPPVLAASPVFDSPGAVEDENSLNAVGGVPETIESAAPPDQITTFVPDSSEPRPEGVRFSREQLAIHAGGRISEIFGELFERQDAFARQVRMPEPPLLLADRVTGLKAEAGSMGTGTVWTETDVRRDAWYLNAGRMPAGVMIESGQADLFLISYLGVDFQNRGERVYRLLGCELTYRGRLPAVGDTLRYDIHVDGHAAQGDIRLFFFHYDCRVGDGIRLSVRNGQAGFFTDEELADSGGILWDPESGEYDPQARLDSPAIACGQTSFSNEALRAFSEGDVFACFGPGFEYAQTHVRPPKIQSGRMLFLDEVTNFDSRGGHWGRGYLRARSELRPDDWFFAGHFKNDPCMPGTLMFEGCLQAMAFYLTGLGYTVARDGWLFEPVPEEVYKLMCRGQATPESREIIYEVFVEEVHDGPMPTLFADLLCTIDGRKAFHARRMGLRLVPDWPLTSRPELLENYTDPVPVAQAGGLALGYASLLACAWGPPSDAFGEMYRRFDGPRTVPRLPGPPYHFMSRVTKLSGEIGELREGARVEIEYDVPAADEWYFGGEADAAAAGSAMPFAVLLEAALQPCGWLASYVGSTLTTDDALFFRNLDGTAKLMAEVAPAAGVFRTAVELTSISQTGPMIIQSFDVNCYLNERHIYEMQTVFGFFPAEALANQVGLAVDDETRERCFAPSDFFVDLSERPGRYFSASLALPDSMLCMLDRVTGYWPAADAAESRDASVSRSAGAEAGKAAPSVPIARLRGEKDVRASEWFFKAHFFQDPVQPGSLGLEALLQLLQFYMIHEGLDADVDRPRFEVIQLDEVIAWKYRGQVVPKNKLITSELEVLKIGRDERGPFARAQGWLWVDGKRIYHFADFGLRIVSSPGGPGRVANDGQSPADKSPANPGEEILDPGVDVWLADHCPTYTIPVLPMMSVFDRLAGVAYSSFPSSSPALRFEDLVLSRWISFADGPRRLRSEVSPAENADAGAQAAHGQMSEARLSVWREAQDARFSRFDVAATLRFATLDSSPESEAARPRPLAALDPSYRRQLPYASGAMFHGPAFQLVRELREDPSSGAASGFLDLTVSVAPRGTLHQIALDAATHLIPADRLHEWSQAIAAPDQVAYPARVIRADVFEALTLTENAAEAGPAGDGASVRVEARMLEAVEFPESPGQRFPVFRLQWILSGRGPDSTESDERVAIEMDLAYALFPKGPLGVAAPEDRRAFLRDRRYVDGVSLSRHDQASGETRATLADLHSSDWLNGTVASVYDIPAEYDNAERLIQIAAKDHAARVLEVHPGAIICDPRRNIACAKSLPYNAIRIDARLASAGQDAMTATVRGGDGEFPLLDADLSRDEWRAMLGCGPWPGEALIFGLIQKFVRRFVVEEPADFARLRGRKVLYLGNHQVGIESVLFAILAGAYSGVPLKTIAKIQHSESYIGRLIDCFMSYPGVQPPESIIYFDEDQPATFLDHLAEFRRDAEARNFSLMVHAEASRAYSARHEVRVLSQVLVDFAVEMNFPIVPVWFAGGLPVETQTERIEFPCEYGSQDYHLGRSVAPEELRDLRGTERVQRVLAAINATGPAPDQERPNPPDSFFAERVAALRVEAQIGEVAAVMRVMLESLVDPGPEIKHVLAVLAREDATPAALADGPFREDREKLDWMRKLAAYLSEV